MVDRKAVRQREGLVKLDLWYGQRRSDPEGYNR
jgi:hypothetical protein